MAHSGDPDKMGQVNFFFLNFILQHLIDLKLNFMFFFIKLSQSYHPIYGFEKLI
jgi:hypothetical protein